MSSVSTALDRSTSSFGPETTTPPSNHSSSSTQIIINNQNSSYASGLTPTTNPTRSPQSNTGRPPRSNALIKLILSRNLTLVKALCEVTKPDDYEELSIALIEIFEGHQQCLHLIKWVMAKQISETESPTVIFRGVSVAARIVSMYCKGHGENYLKLILNPVLSLVCNESVSLEVDPLRLEDSNVLKENQKLLKITCKNLLNQIMKSTSAVPKELKYIFHFAQNEVIKKFPDFPETKQQVVTGFYFLRFICPALVSPERHGLLNSEEQQNNNNPPYILTAQNRRSLVLISKVLQNLANDVEFGEKESYMTVMNSLIRKKRKAMQLFFESISQWVDDDNNINNNTTTTTTTTTSSSSSNFEVEITTPLTSPTSSHRNHNTEPYVHQLMQLLKSSRDAIGRVLVKENQIKTLEKLHLILGYSTIGLNAVHQELILQRSCKTPPPPPPPNNHKNNNNRTVALFNRGSKRRSSVDGTPIYKAPPTIWFHNDESSRLHTHCKAEAELDTELIQLLKRSLVQENREKSLLQSDYHLLKLQYASEKTAREQAEAKNRKLKQYYEDNLNVLVDVEVWKTLEKKRERMSLVMNHFLETQINNNNSNGNQGSNQGGNQGGSHGEKESVVEDNIQQQQHKPRSKSTATRREKNN